MGKGRVVFFDSINDYSELFMRLPSTQRDIYYTAEYNLIYQNNGDGRAACYVYADGGELILYPFLCNPIRPLGYSLEKEYYDIQGAYGYNGIVTTSQDSSFVLGFHRDFDAFCQENDIVAEFTRFHPLLNNQKLASSSMKTFCSRHTIKLDLTTSIEDIWQHSFTPKNRNVIKKAEKEGVSVVESSDYECFRRIYNHTMQNVGAEEFYFFPEQYYSDFQKLICKDLMLCFAVYEGKPIAGSMFMFCGDYAHYHLSGRDLDYYKIAANNAVLWYAIKKAKERGCKWFHFGGGATENEADPLLHFKKNFSRETGEFWFGKRIHNHEVYDWIVEQWKDKYPESYEKNSIKLLGYRDI